MKKGFTLIELLAVIVILAIIALIVTPVVSNIVANARISANARSVEGHIRNIELAIISQAFAGGTTGDMDSYDAITSGETIEGALSRPGNDTVTCESYTIKHGTVLSATGCTDQAGKWAKEYNYTNTEGAVVAESGNGSGNANAATYNVYSPGTLLYFDPVTTNTCNADTFDLDAVKAGTSTCYKWRTITVGDLENASSIILQLDHNLLNPAYWYNDSENWESYNYYGPRTLLQSLATATSEWERVPLLSNFTYDTTLGGTNIYKENTSDIGYPESGYNYGILSCTNGICTTTCDENDTDEDSSCVAGTMNTTPLRARVITGEEIRSLTMYAGAPTGSNADNWTLASDVQEYFVFSSASLSLGNTDDPNDDPNALKSTALSWLIENTYLDSDIGDNNNDSGATNDVYNEEALYGYWTLSPYSYDSNLAWYVGGLGYFENYYDYYINDSYFGARPVIEISKTLLG